MIPTGDPCMYSNETPGISLGINFYFIGVSLEFLVGILWVPWGSLGYLGVTLGFKWDPCDIISYYFLSLGYPWGYHMGSLVVSLGFLGMTLGSKWDPCCYQCLSLMYDWGSLGLKDAPLILTVTLLQQYILYDLMSFSSTALGSGP